MIGAKLGKYTLLQTLGAGSMGTVYQSEEPGSGRPVAVKVVKSSVLYDAGLRERFLQGLLAASEIRHRGICPVLEIGDDDDDFFVVMPLLAGHTLKAELKGRPIDGMSVLRISLQIGEALEAVHGAGAVHRALKPANVWIQPDGSILLTDCGLARFTEIETDRPAVAADQGAGQSDALIPLAALAYMSPEQVSGRAVDHRTDIFSFGVLLFEMLTGRHPFDARNSLSRMSAILEFDPPPVSSRAPGIPRGFDPIVSKALAKSPEARFQSVAEMIRELRRLQQSAAADDHETDSVVTSSPRRTWPALLLILALLVLAYLLALR